MAHLRIKGPVTASLVILIFLLEGTTMPSQARDEPDTVIQKLGSHSYAIPRAMIEMIYKPDWSKVPDPNPNWSHEPVIRLAVQWPDFAAAQATKDVEVFRRKINISLSSLQENPLQSVDDTVKSFDSKDLKPRIIAAEYGLQQLLTKLRYGTRDYIATTDDQARFLIHCDPADNAKPAGKVYGCDGQFPLGDLNVGVSFTTVVLPEWKELFTKVGALIAAIQRD
jgi:hypothetical protein